VIQKKKRKKITIASLSPTGTWVQVSVAMHSPIVIGVGGEDVNDGKDKEG